MKAMSSDPREDAFRLATVKVAVLGYDAEARAHALALRAAGHEVEIGLAPTMASWAAAKKDGFVPQPASAAIEGAGVVVCARDDAHPPFRELPLDPRTLVVFGCGLGLPACSGDLHHNDVVLVSRVDLPAPPFGGAAGREQVPAVDRACRVAVHRDTTGRALVRAIAYARAAFGNVSIEVSTVATEVDFELGAVAERPGSVLALLGTEGDETWDEEDPGEIAEGERPSFVRRGRP